MGYEKNGKPCIVRTSTHASLMAYLNDYKPKPAPQILRMRWITSKLVKGKFRPHH